MIISERTRSFLIYTAKCVSSTIAVFICSSLFHYTDIGWCLVSVILVLSPDGKDALPLAVTRIKANVIGVSVAVCCLMLSPSNMWIVSMALTATLSMCYLLKLDDGIRSALAATVIIMLHDAGKHLWDTAIERIIAVFAGCILGLVVTFIFHFRSYSPNRSAAPNQHEG